MAGGIQEIVWCRTGAGHDTRRTRLDAAGGWLWRRQALEHLGWIGPGLALTVTIVLLIIGGRNRHAISAMAASVDFVEAIAGTDDLSARGIATYYTPESGPLTIKSAS